MRVLCGLESRLRGAYTAPDKMPDMLANTAPFDLTGHPATSIPAGLADGLPVAMMIVAPRFQDALALRVAQAYEHARGAFPKPPAL